MDRPQVDSDGLPVTEAGTVEAGRWFPPVRGGAMPSFAGVDGRFSAIQNPLHAAEP